MIENNEKTIKISEDYETTEKLLNSNQEIEEKITTTSLIEFYLDAVKTQNELISTKDSIEKDFDKITKIVNEVSNSINNIRDVVDKQKEENKYKDTIDKMYESFDTLKTFGNNLTHKLNNAVLYIKEDTNKPIFEDNEEFDWTTYIAYFIVTIIIVALLYFGIKLFKS